jgi:hypothetical protein
MFMLDPAAERMLVHGRHPPWVGSRSPMGWWFGLAPVTVEF